MGSMKNIIDEQQIKLIIRRVPEAPYTSAHRVLGMREAFARTHIEVTLTKPDGTAIRTHLSSGNAVYSATDEQILFHIVFSALRARQTWNDFRASFLESQRRQGSCPLDGDEPEIRWLFEYARAEERNLTEFLGVELYDRIASVWGDITETLLDEEAV
jgi:hypothetical protein